MLDKTETISLSRHGCKKVKQLGSRELGSQTINMDCRCRQAPLPMEFSRQEYWSRLPFPSPGDLPDPGMEPGLLHGGQSLYSLSHQGKPINVATATLAQIALAEPGAPKAPVLMMQKREKQTQGLSREGRWRGETGRKRAHIPFGILSWCGK